MGNVASLNSNNMETALRAINKWVYWCMNYTSDFIGKVWADEPWLVAHLESKFDHYWKTYGSDAVMNVFYCELDGSNKKKLMAWVMDNYNDEQKLNFNGDENI